MGYDHEFVPNIARRPGSDHFNGIRNPGLIREITRWGACAILVYGWNQHSHLKVLRHFKGKIPVLFRGDSTLLDPCGPLRMLVRRTWLKWVYSHIDVAIAVGQNNRDYFAWCGVDPHRIAFAPHSVDTVRFGDSAGDYECRARSRASGAWNSPIPPSSSCSRQSSSRRKILCCCSMSSGKRSPPLT